MISYGDVVYLPHPFVDIVVVRIRSIKHQQIHTISSEEELMCGVEHLLPACMLCVMQERRKENEQQHVSSRFRDGDEIISRDSGRRRGGGRGKKKKKKEERKKERRREEEEEERSFPDGEEGERELTKVPCCEYLSDVSKLNIMSYSVGTRSKKMPSAITFLVRVYTRIRTSCFHMWVLAYNLQTHNNATIKSIATQPAVVLTTIHQWRCWIDRRRARPPSTSTW